MIVSEFMAKIREKLPAMMLPVGATAAAAVPALTELAAGDATGATTTAAVASAIGLAGFNVLGDTVVNAMGNMLTDRLNQRMIDPVELLRNHHLHRLCGESIARLIESVQSVNAKHRDQLASKVRDEWEMLTQIDGWQEIFNHHSREGIVDAMKQHGLQWSTAESLTVQQWLNTISPIATRCVPDISDADLQLFAETRHRSQLTAVRELLKEDASDDQATYAALELVVYSEQLKLLTDLANGQSQIRDGQLSLLEEFQIVQQAVQANPALLTAVVDALVSQTQNLISGHDDVFAGLDLLLDE